MDKCFCGKEIKKDQESRWCNGLVFGPCHWDLPLLLQRLDDAEVKRILDNEVKKNKGGE